MAKKSKKSKKGNNNPKPAPMPTAGLPQLMPQGLPKITKEMEDKLKETKAKIDKLTKQILEKFDKYIKGIALLPPDKEEQQKHPDRINILILVDDADSQKMGKEELQARLGQIIEKMAKDIDKNISPEVMLLSELKEACLDGKYEVLKMISVAAPVYDPSDLIAAIRISEVHKSMTLKKFEKYIISYVAAGSLFRGEKSNDIDVYVIVDDTDVKRLSRVELKDKLRAIIHGMGAEAARITGVKKQFHVQTYILTDFWDNLKDANPVIFTLLRDGVPLYDRGVFMPWKLLLQTGRVKPSPEAIDMNMDLGERLLKRIKFKMLSVVGEDLYYAVLNPAQAALMLYGIPPPTPKETIKLMNEIFVKKEKLLEKKYVDILEKIRTAYKNIEHGKTKEVSGKDIDNLLKDAEDYLKRIKKMFAQIDEKMQKEGILDMCDACVSVTKDLMAAAGEKNVTDAKLQAKFKSVLMEKEKVPEKYLRALKRILKAKAEHESGKLTKQEADKAKKEARAYIKDMVEQLQRKRAMDLEKVKVRFKYGKDKMGEAVLLDNKVFITKSVEDRDKMLVAAMTKDGGLDNPKKTTLEELEKHIAKLGHPKRVFVKEKLFEDLKNLVGEEIEILINY